GEINGLSFLQASPPFPKRPRRRRRKIPGRRPPGSRTRKLAEPTLRCRPPKDQSSRQQGQSIEPRAPKNLAPKPIGPALRPFSLFMMLQLAQADEHVRNVDPHGTSRQAGPAQRRGVRQVRIFADAVVKRRQNAADRTGVDAAVSVAADSPIYWTGI